MESGPTRYEQVSRRALLKASAGLGIALVLPTACGNADAEVFAGALTDSAEPVASGTGSVTETEAVPTTQPLGVQDDATPTAETPVEPAPPSPATEPTGDQASPTVEPSPVATSTSTPEPLPTAIPEPTVAPPTNAVDGEMVISFTYTQAAGGKNERPYVAVWIEDQVGELVETVALWFQQRRRGERWLDHLHRWYEVEQDRLGAGGVDDVATVTSATRQPGAYAVVWDGTIDGVSAAPGQYFVCIEAVREEGPYSLIRVPFDLTGSLSDTPLPDEGELSAARVRIDV